LEKVGNSVWNGCIWAGGAIGGIFALATDRGGDSQHALVLGKEAGEDAVMGALVGGIVGMIILRVMTMLRAKLRSKYRT